MALYAAIGTEFKRSVMAEFSTLLDERIKSVITQTLKQVAHDYELNYKELKSKYCSKESLNEYETQTVSVDLELDATHHDEPEAEPKKKLPKAPKESAEHSTKPKAVKESATQPKASSPSEQGDKPLALSKMKKADLVEECERRGLDSEGTIPQLKERVKDARAAEEPAKPKVKEPKKASKAKESAEHSTKPKVKEAKAPKESAEHSTKPKKATKVKESAKHSTKPDAPPVPPAPSLEEEDFEPVCRRCPDEVDDEVEEDEGAEEADAEDVEVEDELEDEDVEDRQTRLRKILASYGDQFDEDDEFIEA